MICARFQHFSHKYDRRRQLLVVLSFTGVETVCRNDVPHVVASFMGETSATPPNGESK
jgi:hypothetical protein